LSYQNVIEQGVATSRCALLNDGLSRVEEEIATSFTSWTPRNDDVAKYYIPPQIPLRFHQMLHSGGSGIPEPVAAKTSMFAFHVGDGYSNPHAPVIARRRSRRSNPLFNIAWVRLYKSSLFYQQILQYFNSYCIFVRHLAQNEENIIVVCRI